MAGINIRIREDGEEEDFVLNLPRHVTKGDDGRDTSFMEDGEVVT